MNVEKSQLILNSIEKRMTSNFLVFGSFLLAETTCDLGLLLN